MGLKTERRKASAIPKKQPGQKAKKTEHPGDKQKDAHAQVFTSLASKVELPGVGALDGGGGKWLAKLFSGSDSSSEKKESFDAERPILPEAKKRANDYRDELTDEESKVLRKKYFMTMHPDWRGMSIFNGAGLEPFQTVSGDDIAMSIQTGFIPSHVTPLTDEDNRRGSSLGAWVGQLKRLASNGKGKSAATVSKGVLKFVQDVYFPRVRRHLDYFSEQLGTDEGKELTALMADISKSTASVGQDKRDYLPELLKFIQLYNKLAMDSGRGQMFVRPEIMRTQRS